ncbi:hypothetical protein ACFS07_10120 [Undibacterium arcticum]
MNKDQIKGAVKDAAGKVQQKNWHGRRKQTAANQGLSEAGRRAIAEDDW